MQRRQHRTPVVQPVVQPVVLVAVWILFCGWTPATTPQSVSAQDVTIQPEADSGPLDNPLKGWCSYAYPNQIKQPYSMVYFYASWKELEPQEGQYAFEEWEKKAWSIKEANDKHIVFRIYLDYPTLESGVPDWLVAKGLKMTPYDSYGGGSSPDYENPHLVKGLEKLIAALGKRYNAHPRIAFVEAGLLGYWGEWHTYPETDLYAIEKTEKRIVDAYHSAFPDKILMVREARGYAGEQPWLGFHDDFFPDDTLVAGWGFLAKMKLTGRTENWRRAAIGGEMVPYQAKKWMGPEFQKTRDAAEQTHFSWVGPYSPALEPDGDATFLKNCESLVRRMGYQFTIHQVVHSGPSNSGSEFSLKFNGTNDGLAPFYYPWTVKIGLLDAAGNVIESHATDWDIRKWQPGDFSESIQIKWRASAGDYRVAIGIFDPWKNRPAIRFANTLSVSEGWTVLSKHTVND